MSRKLCVCLDFLEPSHIEKIKTTAADCGFTAEFFKAGELDAAAASLSESEVIFGSSPKVLSLASEKLNWFCSQTAGVDAYCGKPGLFKNENCLLTNTSGGYGPTISEHVVMATLMLLRRIPALNRASAEKRWQSPLPVESIAGNSFTILGAGDIGTTAAEKLKALGAARITGISRSGRSRSPVYDEMHSFAELPELLPKTHILIMALPGTPETYHMLNRETLSLLPDGAYVINVGRGTAIEEAALLESLQSGKLAGAALDVFEQEPLPADSPVWDAENLIITHHTAGNMTLSTTRNLAVDMFCSDLRNYVSGKPLEHLVQRDRGY